MTTDTLVSGASLTAAQSLVSQNGIYMLMVSPNGLVFMENLQTGQRYWVVGKLGQGNPVLTMQTNGNLVLMEGNPPQQQWASGTQQYQGAYARLVGNGNLVIYDVYGDPIWSTGTAQGAVVAPADLGEVRAALESALAKLPGSGGASVNVRNFNASAE